MNMWKKGHISLSPKDQEVRDGIRYGRSRRLMTLECAVSTSISNLISGAFIADLVAHLGGGSGITGIINSVASLTTPVQLFSAMLFEHKEKRKKTVIVLSVLVRMLYVFMFMLPMAMMGSKAALPMLVAAVVLYNVMNNLAGPASTNWLVDLVPENRRSRYFANREGVSLVVLAVCMLTTGNVVDYIHATYGKSYGFLFIAMMVLALSIADILIFTQVDEPKTKQVRVSEPQTVQQMSFRQRMQALLEPLKYPSVRRVLLLSVLWSVSSMFGGPFSGAYQVVNLELTLSYITALSVLSILIRVVLTPLSGRIAAKIGDLPVMIYSVVLIGIHYVLWAFTVKENAHILLPIIFVESAVGFAGINFSLLNVQMRSMPEHIRTTAISVTNTIVGLCGFGSTLVASFLVGRLNGASITVGGFVFCDLQMIFMLTAVAMLICAVYGVALAMAGKEKREA